MARCTGLESDVDGQEQIVKGPEDEEDILAGGMEESVKNTTESEVDSQEQTDESGEGSGDEEGIPAGEMEDLVEDI